MLRLSILGFALVMPLSAAPQLRENIATGILAPLLDPVKVATLKGDRPANTRLYKVLYWLETARREGVDVAEVIDVAQVKAGYAETPMARQDKRAICSNRQNLEDFGCFTDEGMAKLRKGGSPTITKGPHAGDTVALDHVLPRSLVPELAAKFYNLEAIDAAGNLAKSAKITARELAIARRWHREGLLSAKGLEAVEAAMVRRSPRIDVKKRNAPQPSQAG